MRYELCLARKYIGFPKFFSIVVKKKGGRVNLNFILGSFMLRALERQVKLFFFPPQFSSHPMLSHQPPSEFWNSRLHRRTACNLSWPVCADGDSKLSYLPDAQVSRKFGSSSSLGFRTTWAWMDESLIQIGFTPSRSWPALPMVPLGYVSVRVSRPSTLCSSWPPPLSASIARLTF